MRTLTPHAAGMLSVEGELVPLKTRIRPAEAAGAVERWLVQVGGLLAAGQGVPVCWCAGDDPR
jgi:hypothetical protein